MSSRLVDFEKSARVIIMQRLQVNDLAGEMLRNGGYEHLCLPMEFERRARSNTSIGFKDPRTHEGELLWPQKCPAESVAEIKKGIGTERGITAQLQQHPVPHSGANISLVSLKALSATGIDTRLETAIFRSICMVIASSPSMCRFVHALPNLHPHRAFLPKKLVWLWLIQYIVMSYRV